ncbi:MAG: MarR family winged helix-turn-helix transcriptional regulator [Oscillospiraceae bacterium]|jgi:DNA-binding MarR family transcriptional regulator|nr:MarR family winged helix-turn-helix transcriptional regulator [Oscillospiraceae bacterium]
MSPLTLREQMTAYQETWRSIESLYGQYAKSEGLTYLGFLVLDILLTTPNNCTQKYICEQLLLPKQTVNAIIKTFWEQGYVEMKEIDADRRNKAIRLSASGQKYAERVMEKIFAVEEDAMGQLTHEQRQALIDFSKIIESNLRKRLSENY